MRLAPTSYPTLSWSDISENVVDNRARFLEFVADCDLWVANTCFEKPLIKTVTRRQIGIYGSLHNAHAGCADQIGFVLIGQRWKNACLASYSLVESFSRSDHFPLICAFKIRFKKHDTVGSRDDLGRTLDEQIWLKYNEILKEQISANHSDEVSIITWDNALMEAAKQCVPLKKTSPRNHGLPNPLLNLVNPSIGLKMAPHGMTIRLHANSPLKPLNLT